MDAALLGVVNNSVAPSKLPKPCQLHPPPNGHSCPSRLSPLVYENHFDVDHPETCSISSADAVGANDLKFMDESSSSSSSAASSFSSTVDPSSETSAVSVNTGNFETIFPSLLVAAGLAACSHSMSGGTGSVNSDSTRMCNAPLSQTSSTSSSSSVKSPPNSRPYTMPSRIPVATRSGIPKPTISLPPLIHGSLKSGASPKRSPKPSLQQTDLVDGHLRGTRTSAELMNGSCVLTGSADPRDLRDSDIGETRHGNVFPGICDKPSSDSGDVLTPFSTVSVPYPSSTTSITTTGTVVVTTTSSTIGSLPRLVSTSTESSSGRPTFQKNGFPYVADSDPSSDHRLLSLLSDSESDTESIAESIYHQPPKAADRGAASRLAKRLFHLDGFRITDVAKHLCKRNDFSQLVGEEFAGLFDFSDQRLDVALRSFLNTFSLTGETQERERILLHFSRRYHACNPNAYLNEDACHTLVCALMLLNTDLHNQGVTRKMSCQEFIQNLSQMHCGDCFSREDLKTLYSAIKLEPIRWPHSDANMMSFVNFYYPGPPNVYGPVGSAMSGGFITPQGFYPNPHTGPIMFAPSSQNPGVMNPYPIVQYSSVSSSPTSLPTHAFMTPGGAIPTSVYWNGPSSMPIGPVHPITALSGPVTVTDSVSYTDVPTHNDKKSNGQPGANSFGDLSIDVNAREYMRGFLVRKWVMESYGKKTSLGRRGWKVYYARLRDLTLCLYKNAVAANAASRAEEAYQLHRQQQQIYLSQLAAMQQQQQQRFNLPPLAQPQRAKLTEQMDSDEPGDYLTVAVNEENHIPSEVAAATAVTAENNESHSPLHGDPTENIPYDSLPSQSEELASILNPPPSPNKMAVSSAVDSMVPASLRSQMSSVYTPTTPSLPFPAPAFVPPPIPAPETVVRIAHAFASRATNYAKKPNVFRLRTREGAEYLFEVNDAKELDLWIERINFVAAVLSAPSMPGPIGSERGFYRPHLPVSCTKLSIREQLEEHQRRLIELGREVDDFRKRMGSGDTRSLRSIRRSDESIKGTGTIDGTPGTAKKSDDADLTSATDTRTSSETDNNNNSTAFPLLSATTTTASSLSSATSSIISVFSTGSLGRRRKASFSSLSGLNSDCSTPPLLTAKQRVELEERIQYTEGEILRYKTYARLLESELFRIQQSSAAVVHAAALAAANNFSPFVGPYGLPSAVGAIPSFHQFGPLGANPSFSTPPPPPPRYFLPRNHLNPFLPSQLTPLAVLGPNEVLSEEPSPSNSNSNTNGETALSSTDSTEYNSTNTTVSLVSPHLPVFGSKPQYGLPCQYYSSQFQLSTPFSPSASGRFYSNPRQWRSPHYRQPSVFSSSGRSNGIMLNGERLTEEETLPVETSPSSLSASDAPVDDSIESSVTRALTASTVSEKFKTSSSAQPVCSPDGMFYEIV